MKLLGFVLMVVSLSSLIGYLFLFARNMRKLGKPFDEALAVGNFARTDEILKGSESDFKIATVLMISTVMFFVLSLASFSLS